MAEGGSKRGDAIGNFAQSARVLSAYWLVVFQCTEILLEILVGPQLLYNKVPVSKEQKSRDGHMQYLQNDLFYGIEIKAHVRPIRRGNEKNLKQT